MLKKFLLILSSLLLFLLTILVSPYQQTAKANIVSKPLTITAKKVAKELAENAAVEMAEHILFEKAINEFINTDFVSEGYSPACLDGPKKTIEDCAPDKRVQIKKMDSNDKKQLANKVEQVLEQKTNTSGKWQKFLDWFIPIFLISGVVSYIESMLDGDSESFLDEVAREALEDTNFILPLNKSPDTIIPMYDWSKYVSELELLPYDGGLTTEKSYSVKFHMPDPNAVITLKKGTTTYATITNNEILGVVVEGGAPGTKNNLWQAIGYLGSFHNGTRFPGSTPVRLYESDYIYKTASEARKAGFNYIYPIVKNETYSPDVNTHANNFLALVTMVTGPLVVNLDLLEVPPVKPDFSVIKPTETIKDTNGNTKLRGIGTFKYTYNNTKIYPSNDSLTGWKDYLTNEDIEVVEDEVIVEDANPVEEEVPTKDEEDLDQLGKNLPKELILALLDMLRSILYFMVRLADFIITIPFITAIPIPIEMVDWFFNVELLGIKVMNVVRTMVVTALSFSIYRIVKKVF
jgi:hypothetical protein